MPNGGHPSPGERAESDVSRLRDRVEALEEEVETLRKMLGLTLEALDELDQDRDCYLDMPSIGGSKATPLPERLRIIADCKEDT